MATCLPSPLPPDLRTARIRDERAIVLMIGLLILAGAVRPAGAQTLPAPTLSSTPAGQHAIHESPAFTRAVRAGTRTRTGRPGPRYWQQYARYDIEARLDPATHRLLGRERVLSTLSPPSRNPRAAGTALQ